MVDLFHGTTGGRVLGSVVHYSVNLSTVTVNDFMF